MITLKTPQEIATLKEGGQILAFVLKAVVKVIKPGVTTKTLDELALAMIKERGATPSFLGHEKYPNSLCVSVNDEVVHGLPKADKIIRAGDIVGLDLGVKYKGLFTDMAMTVPVGKITKQAKDLMKVTEKCLDKAISLLKPGIHLGDVSAAIQHCAEKQGYSVVRTLVGHGVGKAVHEEPRIPNYGVKGTGMILQSGLVLAIEPMLNIGRAEVVLGKDGWTYLTADHSLSAHFEKTVAIVKSGHQVLT